MPHDPDPTGRHQLRRIRRRLRRHLIAEVAIIAEMLPELGAADLAHALEAAIAAHATRLLARQAAARPERN